MATPILNGELIRLRRRLGDIYTEGMVEIVENTVGVADGNIFAAQELIHLYNAGVNFLLADCIANRPAESWYLVVPGYIRLYPASGGVLTITNGRMSLEALNPHILSIMGLYNAESNLPFSYIPPTEYLMTLGGKFPHRKPSANELYFTVLTDPNGYAIFTIPSATYTNCQIVYLKKHANLIVDNVGAIKTLSPTPTTGGSGYFVNDVLLLTQGIGGYAIVTSVNAGVVTGVSLVAPGRNYTTGAGKATSGGHGTGCTLNITEIGSTDIEGITPLGLNQILDYAEAEAIKQKQAIGPEYQQELIKTKAQVDSAMIRPSHLGTIPGRV